MVLQRYKQSRSYGGTLLFLVILLLFPAILLADDVSVTNDISASASTGGNSASSGVVSEGASESHVQVYTEINGEVVTDIDETTVDGELIIEEEVVRPDEGVDVRTYARTYTEGSTSTQGDATSATLENAEMEPPDTTTEDTNKTFSLRTWVANIMSYVFGFFK